MNDKYVNFLTYHNLVLRSNGTLLSLFLIWLIYFHMKNSYFNLFDHIFLSNEEICISVLDIAITLLYLNSWPEARTLNTDIIYIYSRLIRYRRETIEGPNKTIYLQTSP